MGMSLITATSLLGLLLFPNMAVFWAALFGFGGGASFILALSFVSLRAGNVRQAGALSGMAQSIGYILAAVAPPLLGMVHDFSGNWSAPLEICIALCLVLAAVGCFAGRSAHVR